MLQVVAQRVRVSRLSGPEGKDDVAAGGNRPDAGRGSRPDQQDRAGGMVHDEPGGPAQALRAQARLVAVPRHDEQVRLGRGRHHHPFGPPFELELVAASSEPVRGRLEQPRRRGRRLLRQPGRGGPGRRARTGRRTRRARRPTRPRR